MAGRYILLEFEDRDAAQAFVMNRPEGKVRGYRVLAMFFKPRKFCDCEDKQKQKADNWRKHKKFGLYLCNNCGKPSIFHETGILSRLQYVFGFNILEVDWKED